MTAAAVARKPHAFSAKTQRRLLSMLRRRAIGGDVQAAEVLLKLGQQAAGEPATTLPPGSKSGMGGR